MLKSRLKNFTLYATLKAAGHVILFTFQAYQRQKWFAAKVLSLSPVLVFKSLGRNIGSRAIAFPSRYRTLFYRII